MRWRHDRSRTRWWPEPGPPGSGGQDGAQQLEVCRRLTVRLRTLNPDDDRRNVRERALRLLVYHQWMTHQALGPTFTSRPDACVEAVRLR
ncbi:hypothetical protein [Actinacidiphila oryziradicis]|uniref:Uncharacterized protein n=1 Tax=Actinacidiphila oryziradicis TaxID=2571141 RepID=A0A4U0RZ53_9ACTN|nr:hypothetical protein [Actinacidiphila oryziradicis]TJZ93664.1 hypothetical protein FCI23_54195 [Actinacidiphila oryziradicis]